MSSIAIDGAELIDRIEEQLAWIAVAGTLGADVDRANGKSKYCAFFPNHFSCATPWISLGGSDEAVLGFNGGCSAKIGIESPLRDTSRADALRIMADMFGRLRRPLRHAEVREGRTLDGYDPSAYLLSSVALLPPHDVIRNGPARGLRQIWFQDIELSSHSAPSKRAVNTESGALRHDGKDILTPDSARPVALKTIRHLALVAAAQSFREERWTVELSMSPERTGLALDTDAEGARELLRSLGRTPGRKALVHWVSEHYRQRRGPGEPSLVRAHLRGTQFAIAGHMFATVRPSIVDIDRACNGKRFEHPGAQS